MPELYDPNLKKLYEEESEIQTITKPDFASAIKSEPVKKRSKSVRGGTSNSSSRKLIIGWDKVKIEPALPRVNIVLDRKMASRSYPRKVVAKVAV